VFPIALAAQGRACFMAAMTAKIVLARLGSNGDIHPFIALGRALRTRGFDVVAATRGQYRA